MAQLWAEAEAGQRTVTSIAAVYAAAHHAMAQGRAAVTAMYALAGASSLYTSSPLERSHRDMHAMAAHVIAQPMWLEDTGRVALGLKTYEPFVPGLVPTPNSYTSFPPTHAPYAMAINPVALAIRAAIDTGVVGG